VLKESVDVSLGVNTSQGLEMGVGATCLAAKNTHISHVLHAFTAGIWKQVGLRLIESKLNNVYIFTLFWHEKKVPRLYGTFAGY